VRFALALTATQKGAVVLLFTGIAGPLIGFALKRVSGGWESLGRGPFGILEERPAARPPGAPAERVDPAIQAAEVRQMLEAKSERRARRGEAPLDIDAETERLLADPVPSSPDGEVDEELRAEVRQFVIVRNERRRRQGLEPLDVRAETERALADLIGSG
jgi:hypothetical protein